MKQLAAISGALALLNLTGLVPLSWWLVTAPLWVPAGGIAAIYLAGLFGWAVVLAAAAVMHLIRGE